MVRVYEDCCDFWVVLGGEKQSQSKPILFSPQIFWELKTNLKKQSQFAAGQIGSNSYLKGGYDNMPACGLRKNKSNSKPIKDNFELNEGFLLMK